MGTATADIAMATIRMTMTTSTKAMATIRMTTITTMPPTTTAIRTKRAPHA